MLHEWLVVHREIEADYWWFINKRRLVRRFLDRGAPERGTLLEIGCGGGLFSSLLLANGWRVLSADVTPDAARFAHEQGVPKALAFDAGAGWPLANATMDTVIMLDMLEHVRNDALCLAEARRVVRPGGLVVISVPAYPFLFSAWDEYNRHFRRYTAGRLRRLLLETGWKIERLTYWNAVSVPPALLLRLKDRLIKPTLRELEFPRVPRFVNALLSAYGYVETAWIERFNLPFGLSVIAVAHNPENVA